jgi:dTDP-4-dehydrorhamnose reductase
MRDRWEITLGTHKHSVQLSGVDSHELSLDILGRLESQFGEIRPDLIVHAAGLTSVDTCEQFPELAVQANVSIAKNVAFAAASHGINLVHLSTDHLFSGRKSMVIESDVPEPINQYARTKALAEEAVLDVNSSTLVLRTNFFGWGHSGRQSFTDWLIYNLRAGKKLSLFDNVFYTPILADDLAVAAHELVDKGKAGIVNLVGDQRISKYDFACMLADHFSLSKDLLLRHKFQGSELYAARPKEMSLDNSIVRQILGRNLGNISQFLIALRQQELSGRAAELIKSVNPKKEWA